MSSRPFQDAWNITVQHYNQITYHPDSVLVFICKHTSMQMCQYLYGLPRRRAGTRWLTHPGAPRLVLCCSARASGPDRWRSPTPRRLPRLARRTPARPSPARRSAGRCPATRAWRGGRGLAPAAPLTGGSPATGEDLKLPPRRRRRF